MMLNISYFNFDGLMQRMVLNVRQSSSISATLMTRSCLSTINLVKWWHVDIIYSCTVCCLSSNKRSCDKRIVLFYTIQSVVMSCQVHRFAALFVSKYIPQNKCLIFF